MPTLKSRPMTQFPSSTGGKRTGVSRAPRLQQRLATMTVTVAEQVSQTRSSSVTMCGRSANRCKQTNRMRLAAIRGIHSWRIFRSAASARFQPTSFPDTRHTHDCQVSIGPFELLSLHCQRCGLLSATDPRYLISRDGGIIYRLRRIFILRHASEPASDASVKMPFL